MNTLVRAKVTHEKFGLDGLFRKEITIFSTGEPSEALLNLALLVEDSNYLIEVVSVSTFSSTINEDTMLKLGCYTFNELASFERHVRGF